MSPVIQISFNRHQHISFDEIQRIHDYIISLGWTHLGTGYRPSSPNAPVDNKQVSSYAFEWLSEQEPIIPDLPEGVELRRQA